MKVAIDISPLKTGHRFRGIGRYTQNLITSLKKEDKKNHYFLVEDQGQLNKLAVDVIHYPYFELFQLTLPLKKNRPTVVTVHDLIPLVFPKQFPRGIKGEFKYQLQRQSLKGARAIITDSQSSKKDILKFIGFPAEKITIIYLAPDPRFKIINNKEKISQKYQLPEKFILYVGDVNYHKNLAGLIKAFSQVKKSGLKLVLVGKAFENKDLTEVRNLVQLIKAEGLTEKIIIFGFIPDEDLPAFYNLAAVLVLPSFYEGFGMTALEAMACGCPVLAGRAGSLPEICGRASLMVDPYDINGLTRGIEKIVSDQRLRKSLIKLGLEQVKRFSWQKVAQETIRVYENIS